MLIRAIGINLQISRKNETEFYLPTLRINFFFFFSFKLLQKSCEPCELVKLLKLCLGYLGDVIRKLLPEFANVSPTSLTVVSILSAAKLLFTK